jgi:hypothetical protein
VIRRLSFLAGVALVLLAIGGALTASTLVSTRALPQLTTTAVSVEALQAAGPTTPPGPTVGATETVDATREPAPSTPVAATPVPATHAPATPPPPVVVFPPTAAANATPAAAATPTTAAAGQTATPVPPTASTIPVTPSAVPSPPLTVRTSWPTKMEVDRSDTLAVEVVQAEDGSITATVTVVPRTVDIATARPIGTPGVPLPRAFGQDLDGYLAAKLSAACFKPKEITAEYQSLDQAILRWDFNIAPECDGKQIISMSLLSQWKSRSTGQVLKGPVQVWYRNLETDVERPWLTTGQINLMALVSGVIGSGLAIPFLVGYFKMDKPAPTGAGKNKGSTGRKARRQSGRRA